MQINSVVVWRDNLFTMNNKKNASEDPLAGLRKKIGDLQGDIAEIKKSLAKPSILDKIWAERTWGFGVVVVVLGALWYVGGLILERRVQAVVTAYNSPFQGDIHRIDSDVADIKSLIHLLQFQIETQKYTQIPREELKTHRNELNSLRNKLAQLPVNTPGYWPAAFQAITLTSKAISNADTIKEVRESEFSDVTSNPPGGIRISAKRVVLGGLIQGIVFENATVRFTPNVRLINDVFINCVFIFPVDSQNPPKQLQQIGKELLASDLSKVTLNAS